MKTLALRRMRARHGFGVADVFLVLSGSVLAISLALPRIRANRFQHFVRRTIEEVDAVRASAARYHEQHGAWPTGAPDGPLPPEVAAGMPSGVELESGRSHVVWNRWRRTEATRAPSNPDQGDTTMTNTPTLTSMGSITVFAADQALLAALLEHYGPSASFVRDNSWTLMIPAVDSPAGETPADSARPRGPGNTEGPDLD